MSWKKESNEASLKGSTLGFAGAGLAGKGVNESGVPAGIVVIVVLEA
jgi:phosphoglycerate dehydrogenase-like enzyme